MGFFQGASSPWNYGFQAVSSRSLLRSKSPLQSGVLCRRHMKSLSRGQPVMLLDTSFWLKWWKLRCHDSLHWEVSLQNRQCHAVARLVSVDWV